MQPRSENPGYAHGMEKRRRGKEKGDGCPGPHYINFGLGLGIGVAGILR